MIPPGLIKVGIVAVMVGAAWLHGCHFGADGKQKDWDAAVSKSKGERIAYYEGEIAKANAANRVEQARTLALAGRLDDIQTFQTNLLGAIKRVALTTRSTNNETGCPDPRLAPAFRVCWNAAITGNAEAAASCGALGVPAGGAP